MRAALALSVLLTAAVGWISRGPSDVQARAPGVLSAEAVVAEPTEPAPVDPPSRRADAEPADATVEQSWIPVRLEVIDGETGAAVHVEAAVEAMSPGSWDVDPGARWSSPSQAPRRADAVVEAKVSAPFGYVVDGTYAGTGFVSKRADSVRLLAPLRREADLRVLVTAADGAPASRAAVLQVLMGGVAPDVVPRPPESEEEFEGPPDETLSDDPAGSALSCPTDPAADGWLRIRGVPHLLDERLWIVAGDQGRDHFAGVVLDAFGQRHEAEIRLPAEPTRVMPRYGRYYETWG